MPSRRLTVYKTLSDSSVVVTAAAPILQVKGQYSGSWDSSRSHRRHGEAEARAQTQGGTAGSLPSSLSPLCSAPEVRRLYLDHYKELLGERPEAMNLASHGSLRIQEKARNNGVGEGPWFQTELELIKHSRSTHRGRRRETGFISNPVYSVFR